MSSLNKMQDKQIKVYIAILIAMTAWGFSFVWSTQVFEYYTPLATIFLRLFFSVAFLWFFNLFYKKIQKIDKEDYKLFILFSFLEPFLYFIGENYGLKAVSNATISSVIVSTIPLFTPLAAYLYFKEKLSMKNAIGLFISFFGVIFVVMKDNFEIKAPIEGILLLFMAVFSAVVYSLLIVKLTKKYNAFTIIVIQNTIGLVLFFPFFAFFDLNNVVQIGIQVGVFFPLIMLSVFASSMAYILFIYGVSGIGITKANIFANIIPIFTVIYAYYALNEIPNWLNLIGVILVITGLMLTQIKKRDKVNNADNKIKEKQLVHKSS